jgi:cell division septal protein FtsQ
MKLKPQPRASPRSGPGRRSGATRVAPRTRGRGAVKPGMPLHRRIARRLPSLRRFLLATAAAAAVAGLVALVNGPWLRVQGVAWEGARYTTAAELEGVLEPQTGRSVLAVATRDLEQRLARLPAVADVTVTASLTGRLTASIDERDAAFVWETAAARFLGDADGRIFAAHRGDEPLPEELRTAPLIRDERFAARLVSIGDRIPERLLATTMRIVAIDPTVLGSAATDLALRLDDDHGFTLVAPDPGWEIALGVYGLDPRESSAEAAARLERQVTAVRTLFSQEAEDGIGWVDARNPGKVYFRAKG